MVCMTAENNMKHTPAIAVADTELKRHYQNRMRIMCVLDKIDDVCTPFIVALFILSVSTYYSTVRPIGKPWGSCV